MRFLRRTRLVIGDPTVADVEDAAARMTFLNVNAGPGDGPYTCPCCGHRTLGERGGYEICSECDWEDDGQDDHDRDVVRGGPNGTESLSAARARYVAAGGTPEPHVPPSAPE